MQKLLITGASGFLGSRIVEFYKGKYDIYAPSHHEMDILDEDAVRTYMIKVKPDMVVHCAAESNTGTCESNPEETWKLNVVASERIASICHSQNITCIICSSDQVYFGSEVHMPHVELESLKPLNMYGRQKLYMEQSCLQVNPNAVLLRLTWMYDVVTKGEHEHGNFLTNLLLDMRVNKELQFATNDKRGLTDVNEVVRNLEKAFTLPGGVYNFGSYNDRSMYETMKRVFDNLGLSTEHVLENTESFKIQPRNICMNVDKIKKYNIRFSSTVEGLTTVLGKHKRNKDA